MDCWAALAFCCFCAFKITSKSTSWECSGCEECGKRGEGGGEGEGGEEGSVILEYSVVGEGACSGWLLDCIG